MKKSHTSLFLSAIFPPWADDQHKQAPREKMKEFNAAPWIPPAYYKEAEWFKDARFCINPHRRVLSASGCGNEWFSPDMHSEGSFVLKITLEEQNEL